MKETETRDIQRYSMSKCDLSLSLSFSPIDNTQVENLLGTAEIRVGKEWRKSWSGIVDLSRALRRAINQAVKRLHACTSVCAEVLLWNRFCGNAPFVSRVI